MLVHVERTGCERCKSVLLKEGIWKAGCIDQRVGRAVTEHLERLRAADEPQKLAEHVKECLGCELELMQFSAFARRFEDAFSTSVPSGEQKTAASVLGSQKGRKAAHVAADGLLRLCAGPKSRDQYLPDVVRLIVVRAVEMGIGHRRHHWLRLSALTSRALLDRYRDLVASAERLHERHLSAALAGPTTIRSGSRIRDMLVLVNSLASDGADPWTALRGLLESVPSAPTPAPLVDMIVSVMKPQVDEVVLDPASGAGAYVVATDAHLRARLNFSQPGGGRVVGMDRDPQMHRLASASALLSRSIAAEFLVGDALAEDATMLPMADVMMTTVPIGRRPVGTEELLVQYATSNTALAFVQYVCGGLRPGGRAALVVPDAVLSGGRSHGARVRADLLNGFRLHTILRLPNGLMRRRSGMSVIFFSKERDGQGRYGGTETTWVYDMRTGAPRLGARNPLTRELFEDFEGAFGDDPEGRSRRRELVRFRPYTRAELLARRELDLNVRWLE